MSYEPLRYPLTEPGEAPRASPPSAVVLLRRMGARGILAKASEMPDIFRGIVHQRAVCYEVVVNHPVLTREGVSYFKPHYETQ
jgi:hypothetical protein